MAPAGVFLPVPGVGGVRSALLATLRTASSRFAAVSQGSLRTGVAAAAGPGFVSSVAPLGGFAARLPTTRATYPHFRAAAAGVGVFSSAAPMGGVAARLPEYCSKSCFSAPASPASGLRSRTRTLRCCTKTSPEETPPPPQPPPRSCFSKFQKGWKRLQEEMKKSAFKLVLLFIAFVLANLSYRKHPYSGHAGFVIAMCDRSENFIKFISHLAPIVAAFWKGFSESDSD